MKRSPLTLVSASVLTAALAAGLVACSAPAPSATAPIETAQLLSAFAQGTGGAVVSDTQQSTRAGIDVLKSGGNAADAAVAVAAMLGVTDPFVAGLGGGGYLVYYEAKTGQVSTIDGRETARAADTASLFLDPGSGKPLSTEQANVGGIAVGVPGQLALWQRAIERWGKQDLGSALKPAIAVADQGFPVTTALQNQIADSQKTFGTFRNTAETYLPGGKPLAAGQLLKNPDLARTYQTIADQGTDAFYKGEIGQAVVDAVTKPPVAEGKSASIGNMTMADLAAYQALDAEPIRSSYRGLDVYGMGSSSSGGVTVGEALKILEQFPLKDESKAVATMRFLEASKLAFADRNAYVGDRASVKVPDDVLLSEGFAKSRACLIDPAKALPAPQPAGSLTATDCSVPVASGIETAEGQQTNHFVVSDAEGNVASYTNTINFYGGSGILVPGRGFLLNNELTDFDFAASAPGADDPNLPAPGKRPRSSMSPTIVLQAGKPYLALGSPGGSTIITTVLQVLMNRIDLGMSLQDAVAAPRASQRNGATTLIEPAFEKLPEADQAKAAGYKFVVAPTPDQNPASVTPPTIGVVAALEFGPPGAGAAAEITAVGEKERRGGTSAQVVTTGG